MECPNCDEQLERDEAHASDDSGSDGEITCNECEKNVSKVLTCRPCDYDICMKCAKKERSNKGKKDKKKKKKH